MAARGKKAAAAKGMTVAQLYSKLADSTGLKKTDVKAVFDSLFEVIRTELRAGRPVKFANIKVIRALKKATPARQGRNPSTGEPMTFAAKPAKNVVRVRALKALKDVA